jgi:predicted permease
VFIVSMLALYALSYWMQRRLFGLGSSEASVQALNISLPNYAAAGLPLIAAVFGPSDMIYVALSIATGSIVLSPLTLAILEAYKAPTGEQRILARSCRPSAAPCASRSCLDRCLAFCSPCLGSRSRRLPAVPFS